MDIMGNTVGRVNLRPDSAISDLAWNCERFSMEEQEEQTAAASTSAAAAASNAGHGNKRPDGE